MQKELKTLEIQMIFDKKMNMLEKYFMNRLIFF